MKWWSPLAALLAVALAPATARAGEFWIDPATGSIDNDGSAAHPWSTLEEVVAAGLIETRNWDHLPYDDTSALVVRNSGAPVKAGDTIWLRSGYHGAPLVDGAYNQLPITIASATGETPTMSRIHFRAAANWVLRGVSISPSYAPEYAADTMVQVDSGGYQGPSWDITIEGCTLFSVADSSGWTIDDWNQLAANGITMNGDRIVARDNQLRNVNFGIQATGKDSVIQGNRVTNFAGDGMRGLGDGERFEGNTIENCYDVNANHDDGFQSWSVGDGGVGTGEVRGIVLRGNTFIAYHDPDQPFRGPLQGIGCFDGFFVDWVVENNLVITDHYHGISFLGMRDSRIVNNTVIDLEGVDIGPPWIMVAPHKDETPSDNILVRNNLAPQFSLDALNLVEDHDLDITVPADLFVDPPYDAHLLPTAAAIDTGSPDQAPATDHDGVPRPQMDGFDVGAYEYQPPMPDAGVPDAGVPDAATAWPADAGSNLDGPTGAGAGDSLAGGCGCRATTGSGRRSWPGPLAGLLLGLACCRLTRRRRHRSA